MENTQMSTLLGMGGAETPVLTEAVLFVSLFQNLGPQVGGVGYHSSLHFRK